MNQAYKDHLIRKQEQLIEQKRSNLKRAISKHERDPQKFGLGALRIAEGALDHAIGQLERMRRQS